MTARVSPAPEFAGNPPQRLIRTFWFATTVLVIAIAVTARPQYLVDYLGAALILFAALLPTWMWVTGKVIGFPLFPLYALPHLWAYGLPLLYDHPIVMLFPSSLQLKGAVTVAGVLFLGTFLWSRVSRRGRVAPKQIMVMNPATGDSLFLLTFAGCLLFAIGSAVKAIPLSGGAFTIARAAELAGEALACFVLSFRWGEGILSPPKRFLFVVLLIALVLTILHSLIMVQAMSLCAIALLGYTMGARRLPWLAVTVTAFTFGFLHLGKSEIRDQYWVGEDTFVPVADYPQVLADWIDFSSKVLMSRSDEGAQEEEGQSITERASLMHLLLYIQAVTPDAFSYLHGETYKVIPGLLVPRILNEDKARSHEGTYLLAVHYGVQSQEGTVRTTIGFGLLNEAYANFGYIGLILLGFVTGGFYGVVGRWAHLAPLLSFRFLFGILVASYAFQSEFSASVFVTALFQSTVILLIFTAVFMRPSAEEPVRGTAEVEPTLEVGNRS